MAKTTIQDQQYLINRTNRFMEKYGCSKKWLSSKVGIAVRNLSYFCNSRFAIPENQYDRLAAFMDEYDRRMVGLVALEE